MNALTRFADRLHAKLSGYPQEWLDRSRLADWETAHADPDGDVWVVTPPTGSGWHLYRPGSPNGSDFPYDGVRPDAVSMHLTEDGCDNTGSGLWLADIEAWLWSWVAEVSGGTVLETVDGLAWFGPGGQLSEYVIYVRVGGAS